MSTETDKNDDVTAKSDSGDHGTTKSRNRASLKQKRHTST